MCRCHQRREAIASYVRSLVTHEAGGPSLSDTAQILASTAVQDIREIAAKTNLAKARASLKR